MIMMIISLILIAQLIFAYSKANNERVKSQNLPESEWHQQPEEEGRDI